MFPQHDVASRVLPYFSMHEFEALLFSDIAKLSEGLGMESQKLQTVVNFFDGDPEMINTNPSKAPRVYWNI